MNNSGYDVNARVIPNRAAGYQANGDQLMNAPYIDMTIPYSAGSLYSTVDDLLLWDQALYTNKLLPDSLLKKMFTKFVWTDEGAQPGAYGYGWFLNRVRIGSSTDSVEAIEHGGGIYGFSTLMFRVPKSRLTLILLSNVAGSNLRDMIYGMLGILYNKPYDKAKESLVRQLQKDLAAGSLEQAIAAFRINKKDKARFVLREGEINGLGYQLMGSGKMKEAVEVFKLMVESFPESSNAYDSLGEGYMNAGDKENAIKNYERSLQLDPRNDNARETIKRLKEK
jgi:CubicO group peptidase (beta-lactamase class C family)